MKEFDKLIRMVQRQSTVSEPLPPFFLKTIASLETSVTNTIAKEKEAKKKMNATNAKALTAMRQKVKKTLKEYEKELKQYQAVCICNTDLCVAQMSTFCYVGPGDVRARLPCHDY